MKIMPSRQRLAGSGIAVAMALVAIGGAHVLASSSPRHLAQSAAARQVQPRPRPKYDPQRFTTYVDNAWFPLKPGITYIYRGNKDGKRARDVYRITNQTRTIDGVACRVVKDRLYLNGRLEEKTSDYYTQDVDGNVWYFGEDTEELDAKGHVRNREGSWRTGKDGAQAGIFMQANPQVGDQFPQEFYRHHAEDHYQVLSLAGKITVPYGTFGRDKMKRNVELTKEWTPLEPGVRDHKYYVRGIGEVKEKTVKGGHELAKLVKIIRR